MILSFGHVQKKKLNEQVWTFNTRLGLFKLELILFQYIVKPLQKFLAPLQIYECYNKWIVYIINKLQPKFWYYMNLVTNLHNPFSSLYKYIFGHVYFYI